MCQRKLYACVVLPLFFCSSTRAFAVCLQGMFIVTFPYTVIEGGYWAMLAMAVVAYICCYTGKILVDCLYEENASGQLERVRDSYVAIAEDVWGKRVGGRIVNAAQLIELLMTCILYVLLCGELMIGILPDTPLDLNLWIMISSIFLLPCAFLKSLRHVSWLSFWCTVAHMFINAIIIIYCFTTVGDWKWNEVPVKINIWTFPISLGVVIFSYTSQIFLPTLEGNLIDRTQFGAMMHWTHVAAGIFKVAFSWIGFLAFGLATKEFITNNLTSHALKVIVNLFLVAKALLSYPLPYYASVELLEATFFRGRPETVLPSCYDNNDGLKVWSVFLRLLLVGLTLVMAIFIPHFNLLMGLIGSFTGNMLSLVWPCYFHLKLKGYSLKWYSKLWNCLIIIIGLICSVLGIYYSLHALVEASKGLPPKPFQMRGSIPVQAPETNAVIPSSVLPHSDHAAVVNPDTLLGNAFDFNMTST